MQLDIAAEEYGTEARKNVDLIMLTGGLTDISTAGILDPKGDNDKLKQDIEKYCLGSMQEVLGHAGSHFPNATIAVVGYFPILSPNTNTGRLFNGMLEAYEFPRFFKPFMNNPLVRPIAFKKMKKKAIVRSRIWIEHSDMRLKEAVDKFNADGGKGRAVFIKGPVTEENCFETPNTLLIRMGKKGRRPLFSADNRISGPELWATDGTTEGTVLLANIFNAGNGGSGPQQLIRLGDKVVFTAIGPFVNAELWATDGTTEGTILLKDIWPGVVGSSQPGQFTVLGNLLVFTATDEDSGTELWATDGTPGGTRFLKDINPGDGDSGATFFTAVGGKMVFQANDGTSGAELWVTDGTPEGTELLKDINPAGSSLPGKFAVLGDKVVFTATTVENGTELWVTDGTSAGTTLLKDIVQGDASSAPNNLQVVGGNVLFTVTLAGGIQQLWTTDGTSDGTRLNPNVSAPGLAGAGVFELPDHAPTVSAAIPDQLAAEGSPFSLTVASGTFSDADAGDRVVLTATGLPSWLCSIPQQAPSAVRPASRMPARTTSPSPRPTAPANR